MNAVAVRPKVEDTSKWDLLLTRKGWFWFGVAFLMIGLGTLIASDVVGHDSWWFHGTWCVLCLLFTMSVLLRIFKANFMVVLCDHRVMFTAAFALYFLIGASLLAFGSDEQIRDSTINYSVNATDAVRVDAVNAIGFGLAVIASALSRGRWFGRQSERLAALACKIPPLRVKVILMVVGTLTSFYTLMFDFGFEEGVISGIWRTASQFVLVAILLGCSYRGKHEAALRLFALLVTAIETISGALLFNKSAMLLPICAAVAGLSVRYGVRKVLPTGLLLLVVLLFSVGGAVNYGRNALDPDASHQLTTRWNIFEEGLAASQAGSYEARYSMWARLCYLPEQVAASNFYDADMGGDELRLIPWLFVMRALVPNKPVITQVGIDFNQKITGSEHSSTGMGIFSSGYYNLGWMGLVLASLLCGWILAQTSAIAVAILRKDALLLLPLALLGVYTAFRIDGDFLADYAGTFIYLFYPLLAANIFFGLSKSRA